VRKKTNVVCSTDMEIGETGIIVDANDVLMIGSVVIRASDCKLIVLVTSYDATPSGSILCDKYTVRLCDFELTEVV